MNCDPNRSEAKWRALRFSPPATDAHGSVRPLLCHPERSRGICSSAGPSWKCFFNRETFSSRRAHFSLYLRLNDKRLCKPHVGIGGSDGDACRISPTFLNTGCLFVQALEEPFCSAEPPRHPRLCRDPAERSRRSSGIACSRCPIVNWMNRRHFVGLAASAILPGVAHPPALAAHGLTFKPDGSGRGHQALRRSRGGLRMVHELGFPTCFLSLDQYIGNFTPALAEPISRSARQVPAHRNHRRGGRPAPSGVELHARPIHHRPGPARDPRRAHRCPPPGLGFRQAARHPPGANPLRLYP